ncbi:MAG: hypothetical protein FWG51_04545, partial [Firmicutes bacterium]|nr:hypothetical protein [Bacillota bacterium]
MFKKFIMTSGVFFIFTCYIYSAPLVQDKFQSIVLTEYGIDTNNLFRGLNEIVQIGTTSYLVALNKDNRIAINKINDMKLEEYMLVNEEIVCSTYSVNTLVLRGIGSVCVDDSQNIYITYLYSDGSIKTAKIYMPSKSIFWNVPYKPNSASTYVPLDSVYYKGNLYLLVSESGDQAKFHIVKIPSDGQSVSNFASQIPSGNGTNEPYFNAIVALKDYIYIYGGRLRMANPMIVAYIVKYDLNGVNKGSRDHTFGTNNGGFVSIVRATSYNDEDVYALYNQSNSTRYKIIKM